MARNAVQFQRGLSEVEFERLYGTEEQFRAVVIAARWPDGFSCPVCGGRSHSEVKTRGLFQCTKCRRQTSPIAGTDFRLDQIAAADLVPGHIPSDPEQAGHLQHRVGPTSRGATDLGLDAQAQPPAGDAGTRWAQAPDRAGRDR